MVDFKNVIMYEFINKFVSHRPKHLFILLNFLFTIEIRQIRTNFKRSIHVDNSINVEKSASIDSNWTR